MFVVDQNMPQLKGNEFAEKAREILQELMVMTEGEGGGGSARGVHATFILHTAESKNEQGALASLENSGMFDGFLEKPASINDIKTMLKVHHFIKE